MAQTTDQLVRWAREVVPKLRRRLARTRAAIEDARDQLTRDGDRSAD